MKTTIITTLILILSASAITAQEEDRYYYVYNYYNFWLNGEIPKDTRTYFVFSQVLVMDDECIRENSRNIKKLFEMAIENAYFDYNDKWDGHKVWKSGEIKIEEIKYVNGHSEANMKREKIAKDAAKRNAGFSDENVSKWIDIPIDIDCVED